MKAIGLLVCFLFALATVNYSQAASSSNIQLDVNQASNPWFLAIAVRDASVDTQSVQLQQASSSTWETMTLVSGWGYYTYTSTSDKLKFPVTIRLSSADGHQLTLPSVISSESAGNVDTGVQYTSATVPATDPTEAPTTPATQGATHRPKHTSAPTTSKHTSAPTAAPTTTSKAPTAAPATTKAPTTKAPTAAPTTTTKAPTTKAPTTAPTSAPTTSGGSTSSGGLKLMVPLYTYPGATWDTVAASASVVHTLAIINPNSGPGNGPDSTYNSYMPKLHTAGVEMVGYVHTSYGARAIADVKADIDVYAQQFPLLVGIFLDEVSDSSSQLSYYQELYSYIMAMPGWKYDIINPGTVPASGYTAAATQIVTYESTASGFANSQNPSFATSANKNMFAMITYGGTSSSMQTAISAAKSKGYYGWVYVTDTGATGATYNSLPSFYAAEASYIASLN